MSDEKSWTVDSRTSDRYESVNVRSRNWNTQKSFWGSTFVCFLYDAGDNLLIYFCWLAQLAEKMRLTPSMMASAEKAAGRKAKSYFYNVLIVCQRTQHKCSALPSSKKHIFMIAVKVSWFMLRRCFGTTENNIHIEPGHVMKKQSQSWVYSVIQSNLEVVGSHFPVCLSLTQLPKQSIDLTERFANRQTLAFLLVKWNIKFWFKVPICALN